MPSAAAKFDPTRPLILLYGDAQLLIGRTLEAIISQQVGDDSGFGVTVLWAEEADVDEMIQELSTFSLMAPHRVIVLRDVDAFRADEQEQLAPALEHLADGITAILTAGLGKGGKPAVVAALRAVIKEHGQMQKLSTPYEKKLPTWVIDEASQRGLKMTREVAEHFVEWAGGQVDTLSSELDKLAIYLGDCQEVTAAEVEAVVTASDDSTVFNLVDAIGQRQAGTALDMLRTVLPKGSKQDDALRLLGMIARQLRLIWQARPIAQAQGKARGGDEAGEDLKARLPRRHNFFDTTRGRDFLLRKYRAQARNFSDVQLAKALVRIYETDLALKGQRGEQLDYHTTLELLIVELCRL